MRSNRTSTCQDIIVATDAALDMRQPGERADNCWAPWKSSWPRPFVREGFFLRIGRARRLEVACFVFHPFLIPGTLALAVTAIDALDASPICPPLGFAGHLLKPVRIG